MAGSHSKVSNQIDFVFWFWKGDQDHAVLLTQEIRAAGFDGTIWAIADGPVNYTAVKQAGATIILNREKLKPTQPSAAIRRNYRKLLERSTATGFIHCDPDTVVNSIPPVPDCDWAGYAVRSHGIYTTCGAATYTSRALLERLLILPLEDRFSCKGGSLDMTMGAALNKAGISPQKWVREDGRYLVNGVARGKGSWAMQHPRGRGGA